MRRPIDWLKKPWAQKKNTPSNIFCHERKDSSATASKKNGNGDGRPPRTVATFVG
jgi:hypothetical protein